ncbi:unnamed protein product [Discosporangium mesarthrocarpum]
MEDDFDDQLRDPNQYDNPTDPASLSFLQHLESLSNVGKATLVYIVLVWVFLLIKLHWVVGILFVLAFTLSATPLFVWWNRIRYNCPLDLVVRSFGKGFAGMFWSVMISFYLALNVIVLTGGPRMTVTLTFLTYIGLEELHKVIITRWSKRGLDMSRESKIHQIAATSTSVGYALAATSMWMIVMYENIEEGLSVQREGLGDLVMGLVVLFMATAFGTPMHVLGGYLVGLEVTRQTHFLKAGLMPFVLRSFSVVQIILWGLCVKNFFGLLAVVVVTDIAICYAMVRRIKRVEATFPVEYLHRVGYLQAFGYGVLPGDDMEEVEIPQNIDVNRLV